jgi:hypothetical protein
LLSGSEWKIIISDQCGEDGWAYATDFPCATVNSFKWHMKVFQSACVRRRCWGLQEPEENPLFVDDLELTNDDLAARSKPGMTSMLHGLTVRDSPAELCAASGSTGSSGSSKKQRGGRTPRAPPHIPTEDELLEQWREEDGGGGGEDSGSIEEHLDDLADVGDGEEGSESSDSSGGLFGRRKPSRSPVRGGGSGGDGGGDASGSDDGGGARSRGGSITDSPAVRARKKVEVAREVAREKEKGERTAALDKAVNKLTQKDRFNVLREMDVFAAREARAEKMRQLKKQKQAAEKKKGVFSRRGVQEDEDEDEVEIDIFGDEDVEKVGYV